MDVFFFLIPGVVFQPNNVAQYVCFIRLVLEKVRTYLTSDLVYMYIESLCLCLCVYIDCARKFEKWTQVTS